MSIVSRILKISFVAFAVSSAALAAEPVDTVFKAMQDELDRSMNRLVIEHMSRPYFLSYRIEDNDRVMIEARYGALVQSQRQKDRFLYTELRVGDSAQDNTNYVGGWEDMYKMREDIVDEDNYLALRHQIWLATDKSYKKALEKLARKKAFLQTHPSKDTIPDFSRAEHLNDVGKTASLALDTASWIHTVETAAEALHAFRSLQDWKVTYVATAANKRYVNSEGARHRKGAVMQQIEVSATAQSADGQRLSAFREFITRDEENPPRADDLLKEVRKMGAELEAAVAAPIVEDYSGPVLFSDYAAAQLVSQLFVSQLSMARSVLTPEDWMSQYFSLGKLAERVSRRVLPDFVTITDEPRLAEWKGHRLLGYQVVDDEGVATRPLTLVDEGRLTSLPGTRQPTKKMRESNGHARTLMTQWTVPAITNLVVKTGKPLAPPQMLEKLRRLARESGNDYGLLVTQLSNTRIDDDYSWMENSREQPELLTSPILIFKVSAKDGKIEPVRGLVFDEVSIRSLRDVAALGSDDQLYGIMQPTVFPQLVYPASIVTPSILVEEMELKSNPSHEPLPLTANPLFEK